jgi:hypothetical protein
MTKFCKSLQYLKISFYLINLELGLSLLISNFLVHNVVMMSVLTSSNFGQNNEINEYKYYRIKMLIYSSIKLNKIEIHYKAQSNHVSNNKSIYI